MYKSKHLLKKALQLMQTMAPKKFESFLPGGGGLEQTEQQFDESILQFTDDTKRPQLPSDNIVEKLRRARQSSLHYRLLSNTNTRS